MMSKEINTHPLVSILVPIYGVEKYIARCAISLMEQTYDNIEYIFVNDCTKDRSIAVLEEVINRYPERRSLIRIINHERNRGLAAARNTAIEQCSGDYIMHVDSDDWLELNAVQSLVQKAILAGSDIVQFGYIAEYCDRQRKSVLCNNKEQIINDILTNRVHASIWSKMYSTQFLKNSGLEVVEGLNQGEDYVMVPRLLHKAVKFTTVQHHLYHYELSNQGSYTRNVKQSAIDNILLADNILYDYFTNVIDGDKYRNSLNVLHIRSMLYLIKVSDFKNYSNIINSYKEYCDKTVGYYILSRADKIILFLLKIRQFHLCWWIIRIYTHLK